MNVGTEKTAAERNAPVPHSLTKEEIDAYIHLAHRLRAQALANLLSTAKSLAIAGLRRLFGGSQSGSVWLKRDPYLHHLRTPLTSIRASSELLIDNPDMPQEHRRRFLNAIHEETLRLQRTVDSIAQSRAPMISSS